MSRKQKKVTEPIQLGGNSLSEDTMESLESQEQEDQGQNNLLNSETKTYLDAVIKDTATSIIQTMR
ncbi:7348_t:CDS:1, partial [Dentiscutata erythropus]